MRTAPGVALGGGRYRLLRRIAVGGMGEVWEANDDALQRPVAVKVLRAEFAGDAGFLERFRTEARNSAALSHPNIAALFDYGEQDGSAYLVMELVVGEPLSDLLEREPVLDPRRLLPVLAQTARGLHAAHLAGVVHRDVKPGNILLARSGKVKITDFGVSLAADQKTMTATGMVMGTAQYLSPEQAVGRPATPLSDLYSLGVVAYEAIAGKRPFTGPTAVDIAVAHVNDPVPPLPTTVERHLAALVLRLLSKEPSERPASGEELAGMLDRLVPQTPPAGVPVLVSRPQRPRDEFARGRRDAPAAEAAPAPAAAVPPSYPPSRRGRAGRTEPAPGTRRAAARTATPAPGVVLGAVRDAGQGLRRLRLPLVILVLVLVALLGAALADRVVGAQGPSDRPPGGTSTVRATGADPTDQYPRADAPDGMITGERRAAPATTDPAGRDQGHPPVPRSTEVKDA